MHAVSKGGTRYSAKTVKRSIHFVAYSSMSCRLLTTRCCCCACAMTGSPAAEITGCANNAEPRRKPLSGSPSSGGRGDAIASVSGCVASCSGWVSGTAETIGETIGAAGGRAPAAMSGAAPAVRDAVMLSPPSRWLLCCRARATAAEAEDAPERARVTVALAPWKAAAPVAAARAAVSEAKAARVSLSARIGSDESFLLTSQKST
mmetsp:Transcript_68451/g.113788  ORF Transcript_68451/g.113788 Transcript_68451/m.113788 type:complete len:205 (+) Transcript_68451:307-921(+)